MFKFLHLREWVWLFFMPCALALVWAFIEFNLVATADSYLEGVPYYPPAIEEAIAKSDTEANIGALHCKRLIDAADDSTKTIYQMILRGVRIMFFVGLGLIIIVSLNFMRTINGLRKELESRDQQS